MSPRFTYDGLCQAERLLVARMVRENEHGRERPPGLSARPGTYPGN